MREYIGVREWAVMGLESRAASSGESKHFVTILVKHVIEVFKIVLALKRQYFAIFT